MKEKLYTIDEIKSFVKRYDEKLKSKYETELKETKEQLRVIQLEKELNIDINKTTEKEPELSNDELDNILAGI